MGNEGRPGAEVQNFSGLEQIITTSPSLANGNAYYVGPEGNGYRFGIPDSSKVFDVPEDVYKAVAGALPDRKKTENGDIEYDTLVKVSLILEKAGIKVQ